MTRYVSPKQACDELGICYKTLTRWKQSGKIGTIHIGSNRYRYDISTFIATEPAFVPRDKYIYCRVSSRQQKEDLERQIAFLREHYPHHKLISDYGSGLNFKRKGLKTLLDRTTSGLVEEIVVAYRDRLCRFGIELIESILEKHNCKLVVHNQADDVSPEQELVTDLISIITVFSSRVYGLRKYRHQIKEDKTLPNIQAETDGVSANGDLQVVLQSDD